MPLVLEVLAHSPNAVTRVQELHVLSKIAYPSTVDDIVPLIDDADHAVAAKARWALSRIGDQCAVPLLTA
ncbi:HEAT repeat domain-containing protein [Rathayibacter iranicus]|uniref:HEAT repeat protein n=1 Tax=Rathayibacter iranicus NCPPB 2253 = VKM Ac-1602 TaxID=1328868 RepID=A0ABX5LF21_9MICO|nr:HEAT repeat domain-containing protein [Rathayibacter iranicus]MWV30189.1 hypothetical protein [Rathayibacter iranicus NCPPB 2253 = VKM Ac-1602]PWJ65375.1 HEAT repeat protein [Rathayibacter iranicus] [Rathayibacter iranicus NCPPB 2253 = VKM Ac-1602]